MNLQSFSVGILGLGLLILAVTCSVDGADNKSEPIAVKEYAEIRIIDAENNLGIPMAELETVHGLRYVSDNSGRIAFREPDLMGTEIYFFVRSHGYEIPHDGFGFAGVKIRPFAGEVAEIKMVRKNIAVRLCRLTGEGLYRDSLLLGHSVPSPDANWRGGVLGQDTVQAAIYRDKIFWVWGDTQRINYPLGMFRTAGATTSFPLPTQLSGGIPYQYFVDDKTKFVRPMMPLTERPEGVIWIHALFTQEDDKHEVKLLGHYSRLKDLATELEQGIAIYDDHKQEFVPLKQLPLEEKWRRPSGHPIVHEEAGKKWLLFGSPSPNIRVQANMEAVLDSQQYETLVIQKDERTGLKNRVWQKDAAPVDSIQEEQLVKSQQLLVEDACFLPEDVDHPGQHIALHRGTVRWNAYRQKWIMIATQMGGDTSYLGEVWYAEAEQPTGPFKKAVKIVTHDKKTFYNVCHHDFLDQEAGRLIHFEGTYTKTFSGNDDITPRYEYNQILYQLDLDTAKLKAVQ